MVAGNKRKFQPDENSVMRLELALKLHAKRIPYEEIAQQCGYTNKGTAYNVIHNALKERKFEAVDTYRKQELAYLDMLQQEADKLIFDTPKGKPDLFAIDRALAISQARRALLNLDVPKDAAANVILPVVREIVPGYLKLEKDSKA